MPRLRGWIIVRERHSWVTEASNWHWQSRKKRLVTGRWRLARQSIQHSPFRFPLPVHAAYSMPIVALRCSDLFRCSAVPVPLVVNLGQAPVCGRGTLGLYERSKMNKQKEDSRVLDRTGARFLTEEEMKQVTGGFNTSRCTIV